jgi:hypothetical protein
MATRRSITPFCKSPISFYLIDHTPLHYTLLQIPYLFILLATRCSITPLFISFIYIIGHTLLHYTLLQIPYLFVILLATRCSITPFYKSPTYLSYWPHAAPLHPSANPLPSGMPVFAVS